MRLFGNRGHAHPLMTAAEEFLDAPDWEASLAVIERNPILLSDTADELLSKSIELARGEGTEESANHFELHRAVIRRVRTGGVGAARVDLGLSVEPGDREAQLVQRYAAGRASLEEFTRAGDLALLDRAIATLSDVVRSSEELGRESADFHASLGWAFMSRAGATGSGDGEDMDAARSCFERALQLTGAAPEESVNATFGLAATLQSRRGPGDLERSIALYESAFESVDESSSNYATLAVGISYAMTELHRTTRDGRALDRAVRVVEEAADRAPSGSSSSPVKAALAHVLVYRYDELNARNDLVRALRLFEELLPLHAAYSPERLAAGADMMLTLNKVERATGDGRYLDQAIDLGEQLLSEAPAGAEARLLQRRLGLVLTNRYAGEDAGRLAEAARLIEEGIGTSADVESLVLLAGCHLNRYWVTDDIADLDRAHGAVVRALQGLRSSFGRFAPLEQLASDRESWYVYSLAIACMLLRATADAEAAPEMRRQAMVAAELGKGRLLTEQVGRGDVPALAVVPAETVVRERMLVDRLVAHDTEELAGFATPSVTETTTEHAARMRHELHVLWTEIEGLGQEARDWVELRRGDPLTWDDLQRLATPGSALVSFAELEGGLVAFVLRHGAGEPVVVESDVQVRALTDCVLRLRREVVPAGRARSETSASLARPCPPRDRRASRRSATGRGGAPGVHVFDPLGRGCRSSRLART